MEYSNILVEKTASLATVTVNRPQVLNALNRQTIEELECAFYELRADEAVRAVILTGAGPKAFVAGADIKELSQLDASQGVEFARRGQAVLELIENLGKPVIAAINGRVALGGGNELAMACHIRIAEDSVQFGQPEIKLGIMPGWGGTQRLPRIVGKGKALELLLTGNNIKAQEAYRIGLVNKVVPVGSVVREAKRLARVLSNMSALAMGAIITAVNEGLEKTNIDEAMWVEAKQFTGLQGSEDMTEGLSAFLEKRRPQFKDK